MTDSGNVDARILPMFPLGSVALPGVGLPLQVFEPRYRALVMTSLSSDRLFGSVLIERGSEVGCEVVLENFGSRSCTDAEKVEFEDQEKRTAERFGQANQSRWLGDYHELPMLLDGGCDLIEIIYDPRTDRIQSTQCNGEL